MWCCGVFERDNTRDYKVIKLEIKLDEQFVACGESDKMEEIFNFFVESQNTKEMNVEAGRAIILEEN